MFVLALYHSYLPLGLGLGQQIIQSGTLDKSDQEYIQKNYKEAEEIVNFISYRKSTMQKVMQYILHAQKAFFLSGPGHRTAMNNAHKRA